jgi:hypothetical protein
VAGRCDNSAIDRRTIDNDTFQAVPVANLLAGGDRESGDADL